MGGLCSPDKGKSRKRESRKITDWWQLLEITQDDQREISKWLVPVVWACLLESFADHGEYFLTDHALRIYEEYANIAECVLHAFSLSPCIGKHLLVPTGKWRRLYNIFPFDEVCSTVG